MFPIASPLPQFFDVDGSPLSGGSVYFGTAGGNPETAPITVYWDAAGTQPAAQPIKTANGYLMRNGTPAQVYTPSDYSVTVKTRTGALAYYLARSALYSAITDAIAAINNGGVDVVGNVNSFPGIDPTGTNDSTAGLQAFLDACKGKRGYLPAGTYKISAQLTMDPAYAYHVEGAGFNSENGANQATVIVQTTSENALFLYYANSNYPGGPAGGGKPNSDNRMRIANLRIMGQGLTATAPAQNIGIEGVSTSVPKGNGIYGVWVNGLTLENVWIDGFQSDGVYLYRSFNTSIKNCYIIKNARCGVHLFKTANAVQITRSTIIGNCRVLSNTINYNVLIDGTANYESLGVVIDGSTDVSYSGGNSPFIVSVANGKLTQIVVASGVATATAPAHQYAVGNVIAVWDHVDSGANCNTIAPATVTAITTNTFTFATTAADGTYNGATLSVGPYASGIGLDYIWNANIEAYCEDPNGVGLFAGPAAQSVNIMGGYWQDARVYFDGTARGGSIGGAAFAGRRSGPYLENAISAAIKPGNRYIAISGRGSPTPYIGGITTMDNGGLIVHGGYTGRGTNIYEAADGTAIGDASNWFSGVNVGTKIQQSGGGLGTHNLALGANAGRDMTTGYSNVLAGWNAGVLGTVLFQCVAVGNRALDTATNTQDMVSIGHASSTGVTSGGFEVNIGTGAGQHDTPSATNGQSVHIGAAAGRVTNGSVTGQTVILGAQSTGYAPTTGLQNFIALGYDTQQFWANNRVQIGNASISSARVQVAWTITSDARSKHDITDLDLGLTFIKALRPRSYKRNGSDNDEELGFIAQEVQEVLPRPLGLLFHDERMDTFGLRKDDLIAPLVKAVQLLAARVEALEAK